MRYGAGGGTWTHTRGKPQRIFLLLYVTIATKTFSPNQVLVTIPYLDGSKILTYIFLVL